MTALSIAQRLGYISVVEELKVVTETIVSSKHELLTEERYKVKYNLKNKYIFIYLLWIYFRFKHQKYLMKNIH
jgi:hypothetical protein